MPSICDFVHRAKKLVILRIMVDDEIYDGRPSFPLQLYETLTKIRKKWDAKELLYIEYRLGLLPPQIYKMIMLIYRLKLICKR